MLSNKESCFLYNPWNRFVFNAGRQVERDAIVKDDLIIDVEVDSERARRESVCDREGNEECNLVERNKSFLNNNFE